MKSSSLQCYLAPSYIEFEFWVSWLLFYDRKDWPATFKCQTNHFFFSGIGGHSDLYYCNKGLILNKSLICFYLVNHWSRMCAVLTHPYPNCSMVRSRAVVRSWPLFKNITEHSTFTMKILYFYHSRVIILLYHLRIFISILFVLISFCDRPSRSRPWSDSTVRLGLIRTDTDWYVQNTS